jgi:hypothetical protein
LGTTTVTIPQLTSQNLLSMSLNYVFDGDDLTESTPKVLDEVDFGTINVAFSTQNTLDELVTLTYNTTNKTLTLSIAAVDYLLNHGSLTFTDTTNNIEVEFHCPV